MKNFKHWLALFAALLLSLVAVNSAPASFAAPLNPSQESIAPPPPSSSALRFERISLEQGLSQSAVLAIHQDRQGFIWMGTEGGLNRYDGYQFTVYKHDPENPRTLSDDYVSSIYEDRQGRMWVGTRSGLEGMDRATGEFIHLASDPDYPTRPGGKWVTTIAEGQDGILWIGTDGGGINRFDPATKTFQAYRHDPANPQSIANDYIRTMVQDSTGNFWVGTRGGLDRFDPRTGVFVHSQLDASAAPGSSGSEIAALFLDRQGILWVGTESSGLYRWDQAAQVMTHYRHGENDPRSLSHDRVRAVLEDRAGRLWVGTQNGLDRFDASRNEFVHYRHDASDPRSLSADTIWSIYEDRSGVLWFGTYSGGVNKYSDLNNRFVLYQHNPYVNSLSDNMVWSIWEDQNGILWIGTLNGGLNRLDRWTGTFTQFRYKANDPGSLSSDDVRAILEDRAGDLWIGTSGGLDRFDRSSQTFVHYRHNPNDPTSLADNRVTVLLQDRQGNLWVGTRNGGIHRLDRATGAFVRYQHSDADPFSLSDDRIWALYQDSAGALWVGTLGGVNVLDPESGRFKHYLHDTANPQSVSHNAAFAFHEDASGAMWIGTWGGGLDRFDRATRTFSHVTQKDGLPDNVIYAIESDARGRLWVSTNKGIAQFEPSTRQVRSYDIRDGLQDNEFNAGAHFQNSRGEIFFGGIQGLNSFYPDQFTLNTVIPPVAITAFYRFNQSAGQNLRSGERIQLNYDDNFVSFDFATLDYTAPGKNQYAYRMEGLDPAWVNAGTRRHADYPNLRPGEYVFRVKGANNDGVWNEEGTAIVLTITPPFWETLWFRGAAALLLVGAILGVFRWRVRDLQAHSLQLEQEVADRTAELVTHTRELDALYRADHELHSRLSLDHVLQALTDVAVDLLNVDKSAIFMWEDKPSRFRIRIARGFSPTTIERLVIPREGSIGQAAASGAPLVVPDVRDEGYRQHEASSLLQAMDQEAISAWMLIPIQVRDEVLCVFTVAFLEPHVFSGNEQRLYVALGQRAALAIENAQLYERSQEVAALEERNRLARELHDAVTQTLFAASLTADVLPRLWDKDPGQAKQQLNELQRLNRGALAEMRTLLLELRPAGLDDAQFPDLIRQLAQAAEARAQAQVRWEVAEAEGLPLNVKIAMYRIAQEALNNVIKHARATAVSVSFGRLPAPEDGDVAPAFVLTVIDNGCGFDPSRVPGGHLGVGIMRERAQAIGAQLAIESQPGQGTRLRVLWRAQRAPATAQQTSTRAQEAS